MANADMFRVDHDLPEFLRTKLDELKRADARTQGRSGAESVSMEPRSA
ncbi:hypothetical protein [Aureimonas sp. AU22]|nr:hypothetical protein [Aureimonas sp. AU22]